MEEMTLGEALDEIDRLSREIENLKADLNSARSAGNAKEVLVALRRELSAGANGLRPGSHWLKRLNEIVASVG